MGTRRIKLTGIVLAGIAGLGLAWAPSALAFKCSHVLDKFNRPTSGTLGSAWTERAFHVGVQLHRAFNAQSDPALATYKGVKSKSACADVFAPTSLGYVAIDLGYKNLKHNIFIKVQGSGGMFDTAYAYRGNNGVPLVTNYSTGLTPFSSAQMYVTWSGSTVKLEISTLFNNRAQQEWTITGVSTAGLGNKIGLGIYGGASADNYAIP